MPAQPRFVFCPPSAHPLSARASKQQRLIKKEASDYVKQCPIYSPSSQAVLCRGSWCYHYLSVY
eukprot:scaffold8_cov142-Skeletonema_marinoi.AAC.18